MYLQIVDTFSRIADFRAAYPGFDRPAWRRYAQTISPSLGPMCEKDASAYDMEREVLPVLRYALGEGFARVEAAHQALSGMAAWLPDKMTALAAIDFAPRIIFYLGLCNGAGWACELDGAPVILLGAEKIAELGWHEPDAMADLVCHELAHLIHFALRGNLTKPDRAVWQLYAEGFATRTSQLLYKENYYHLDQGGWLAFGQGHLAEIKAEYRWRWMSGEGTADFFGDWHQVMGYSNLGYFLGCEWMRRLEKRMSLEAIACLTAEEAARELRAFLAG